MTTLVAILAVLAIIYVVPFVVYGVANATGLLEMPAPDSPGAFLLGVGVTKLGTAVAFVLLLQLSAGVWGNAWATYGVIWFVMFAASEIGDALSRRSSWMEAALGIAAEAIYAPVASFAAFRILGVG